MENGKGNSHNLLLTIKHTLCSFTNKVYKALFHLSIQCYCYKVASSKESGMEDLTGTHKNFKIYMMCKPTHAVVYYYFKECGVIFFYHSRSIV